MYEIDRSSHSIYTERNTKDDIRIVIKTKNRNDALGDIRSHISRCIS
jgi:hypothetical protein